MLKKRPFVFVLMPFQRKFKDVYVLGIKQACKDAGAQCERVDEQIFSTTILQQIYEQIKKADIIVADMSGRNANVFYETGYAHALGKHVILLTQQVEDIPFDLKHFPHIIYGSNIITLKETLTTAIKHYIKQNKLHFEASSIASLSTFIPRFPQFPSHTSRMFLDSNSALTGKYSIDDCIMLCHSPEYQGWDWNEISLSIGRKEILHVEGKHDAYVQDKKPEFGQSGKWKYCVLSYTLPMLDKNRNEISLDLGLTDFSTSASVYSLLNTSIPEYGNKTVLQNSVQDFFTDVGNCQVKVASQIIPVIPCVDMTILDAKDRVLILQRSKHVHFFPETWTATIEEQMNAVWKGQIGDGNVLDAAKRSLREEVMGSRMHDRDILNLKFLALLFNPIAFSLDIVGVAKINMLGEDIARNLSHRAIDPHEHGRNFKLVDLTPDGILPLIFPQAGDSENSRIVWHSIARMRLLLILLWKYGFDEVSSHPIIRGLLSKS